MELPEGGKPTDTIENQTVHIWSAPYEWVLEILDFII